MTPLEVNTTHDGTAATVAIEGELDLATVDLLDATFAQVEGNASSTVIVDLARLEFIDSTGLRCLLRARRRAEEAGRRLTLTNVTTEVRRVFDVTGAGRIFEIT